MSTPETQTDYITEWMQVVTDINHYQEWILRNPQTPMDEYSRVRYLELRQRRLELESKM